MVTAEGCNTFPSIIGVMAAAVAPIFLQRVVDDELSQCEMA